MSVPSVLISAQVKAGLDELKERMPRKAIRIQELRRVSGSPVVMVAVFITSFCRQKPRGKSDWLQTETERELVSEGEDILAQQRGEMPTRCRGKAEEGHWTNVNVVYS